MVRPIHLGRLAREPRAAIGAALVAVCALILASCEGGPPPSASAEAGAAPAAHASPAAPAAPEGRVLASRIMQRESDDLLLDAGRHGELSREIARVLTLIRQSHPAMGEISARDDSPPTFLLGLDGALRDSVARRWGEGGRAAPPRTGHTAFDALNERLGLEAVRVWPALGSVALHLGARTNVDAAIGAYEAIDGVDYAEPDAVLGDGSDVHAAQSDGAWHVLFRRAWGDCPAGCLYEELSYFTVQGDRVEQVEPR